MFVLIETLINHYCSKYVFSGLTILITEETLRVKHLWVGHTLSALKCSLCGPVPLSLISEFELETKKPQNSLLFASPTHAVCFALM